MTYDNKLRLGSGPHRWQNEARKLKSWKRGEIVRVSFMATAKMLSPVGAIFCVACATTGEVREKEPVFQSASSRPSAEIVGCTSDELSKRSIIFQELTRSNGRAIILGPTHNPDIVIDVDNTPEGSSLTIYRQPRMYLGLSRAVINTALACAGLPLEQHP